MIILLQIIFWTALVLLFWIYGGYQLALMILTKFVNNKTKQDISFRPKVSFLILTYNEEIVIKKKLENTLMINYPSDKLEIIVVDSASNDNTINIVNKFSDKGIKVLSQPKREGKASGIQYGMERASGEIIITTDANAYYDPEAVNEVVKYFTDQKVGGVSGSMQQISDSDTLESFGGGLYWKIEKLMRINESKLHSSIGMSGEISVFRKNIFKGLKLNDWYEKGSADDFCLSLFIISKGYRIIYSEEAKVWESAPNIYDDLKTQKVRIITQTIRSFIRYYWIIFSGKFSWYSFLILPSHKLMPLFSPLLIILLFISSIFIYVFNNNLLIFIVLVMQIIFYLVIVFGNVVSLKNNKIIKSILFFYNLNILIFIGWKKFSLGFDYTAWDKILSSRKK